MQRLVYLLLACVSLGLVAARVNLSEQQVTTCDVLSDLNFEQLPNDSNKADALPKFKVTKATLEFLKKYEGKTIEVADDGTIDIEEN